MEPQPSTSSEGSTEAGPSTANCIPVLVTVNRASLEQCQQLFGATCRVKLERCEVPTSTSPAPISPSAEVPADSRAISSVGISEESETESPPPAPQPGPSSSKEKRSVSKENTGKEISQQRSLVSCRVCGKAMSSKRCLKRHMRKHTGEKPYKCEHCGRSFWSPSSFDSHQKRRDQRNGVCVPERNRSGEWKRPKGAWECNICGKRMKYADSYEPHLKKHGILLPFKCGNCGKTFVTNKKLHDHSRVHNKIWKHSCVFCGKGFHRKIDYWSHLRGHSEENPYFCEVKDCGASYRHVKSLKHHQRVVHLKKD